MGVYPGLYIPFYRSCGGLCAKRLKTWYGIEPYLYRGRELQLPDSLMFSIPASSFPSPLEPHGLTISKPYVKVTPIHATVLRNGPTFLGYPYFLSISYTRRRQTGDHLVFISKLCRSGFDITDNCWFRLYVPKYKGCPREIADF